MRSELPQINILHRGIGLILISSSLSFSIGALDLIDFLKMKVKLHELKDNECLLDNKRVHISIASRIL
jgi:hypothetical protein